MTARHPFSGNTLQRRNHRPPRETHSAQAVETPFEKKRRKTRWRVQRSEASAQERPATEEIVAAPGSERQNTKSGIARARFGKRRRIYYPPTLSFSGNSVGLSCRIFRRQLAPVPGKPPRTRAGTGSARHPVPAHETHSAQAVETPFEKTQEDKMASAALRSIGTRASCHRRNRRGSRFRETEYEMRASREPDSGSVGGFTILRRFLFLEIRSASRAGFSGDSLPRFRESPREHAPAQAPRGIQSPNTDGLPVPKRKHGRPQKRSCTASPPFGMRASVVFHRLAKLPLQRTKHRRDIPQHIRDPLFLLPVSSALQAAPDHFDIRPHIPFGTQSSIVSSIALQDS